MNNVSHENNLNRPSGRTCVQLAPRPTCVVPYEIAGFWQTAVKNLPTGVEPTVFKLRIYYVMVNLVANESPEPGKQPAEFVEVLEGQVDDKRRGSVPTVTLIAKLRATDSAGDCFSAARVFRLDSRGLNALKELLKQWRKQQGQSPASPKELKNFDVRAEFVGKPAVVVIPNTSDASADMSRFSDFQFDTSLTPKKGMTPEIEKLRINTDEPEPVRQLVEA